MKKILIATLVATVSSVFPALAQECEQDSSFVKLANTEVKWEKGLKLAAASMAISTRNHKLKMVSYDTVPVFRPYTGDLDNGIEAQLMEGKVFTVAGFESASVEQLSSRGEKRSTEVFYTIVTSGKEKYKIISSYELKNRVLDVFFQDFYSTELFDKIKKQLEGKQLFTKTFVWFKLVNTALRPVYDGTWKYEGVEITRVERFSDCYLVFFKHKGDSAEYVFDLSSTSKPMSVFYNRLSFCNPKESFKDISVQHWEELKQGLVSPGMPQEAIKAMYGEPDGTSRVSTEKGTMLVWVYHNIAKKGYQIGFVDGVVVDAVIDSNMDTNITRYY